MLEIVDLYKSYEKDKPVLGGINLHIGEASVFGLVGINGAGKSTLLRLIAGVLCGDRGQVCIDGENIYENERKKREIFFLPDEPYFSASATAESLAKLYRSVYDLDEKAFGEYLAKFKLDEKAPLRNFSKGMKRQAFVALALAVAPKYLLLDEAFDGLDPLARLVFREGLKKLVEEKRSSVIISSHSLRELEDICDSYGILDGGKITRSDELEQDMRKLRKFQIALVPNGKIDRDNLGFVCTSFTQTGRVVQLVAKGEREEIVQKLQTPDVLFVEEIEADFEELFIGEVKSRGYLQ